MEISCLCIEKYNRLCLHYELIAKSCYSYRKNMSHALSDDFLPHIISMLIVFDMQRKMGQGLRQKYDINANGFAKKLHTAIQRNSEKLYSLENHSIDSIDLEQHSEIIKDIYEDLALNASLDSRGHEFHVGATKVLHFIHPKLFPIVDSNSASVLREEFHIDYRDSVRPGYTSQKYIESIQAIKGFVSLHGVDSLQLLDPLSPLPRIFDKLAFVKGAGL